MPKPTIIAVIRTGMDIFNAAIMELWTKERKKEESVIG